MTSQDSARVGVATMGEGVLLKSSKQTGKEPLESAGFFWAMPWNHVLTTEFSKPAMAISSLPADSMDPWPEAKNTTQARG